MRSFSRISKIVVWALKGLNLLLAIASVLIFVPTLSHAASEVTAKPLESRETIRTFDEFMRLSVKDRSLYIVGVEGLINALSESDKELQTEYQSADARWDVLEAIFGVANAADDSTRRCIYAGSVSVMNGRYCVRPDDQGCAPKITCNPLLYGAGNCVPGGSQAKYASKNCATQAKPLSEIVKEVAGKRADWDKLREDISGYCESPRPSQKNLCLTIKARLSRIEATLPSQAETKLPAPKLEAEQGTSKSEAPAGKVHVAPANDSGGLSIRPVPKKGGTTSLAPTSDSGEAVTKAGGICSRSFLLGDLKNENDMYTYGLNLMSIGEAQDMMCKGGEISQAWVDEVRKMLRFKLNQVNTVPARYRNNEKAEIEKVSANFEACLKEARQIRAGHTYSDPYPNSGTIQIAGYQVGVPSYKQNPREIKAVFTDSSGRNLGEVDVGHMGAWIEQKQISVCKVKIIVTDLANPEERNVGRPAKFSGAGSGK